MKFLCLVFTLGMAALCLPAKPDRGKSSPADEPPAR